MGYRSRVVIRTTPKGLEMLRDAWDAANPHGPLAEACSELYTAGDVSTVGFSEIKWSSMFPEVAAVEGLLQVDGLGGEPWSFVRCGEEQGDFEELYCDAISAGEGDLERYLLFASQYVEGSDGIPIVPDFNLREMAMLVLSLYENVTEHDAPFAEKMLAGSKLLRDMVDELERQRKELGDERG